MNQECRLLVRAGNPEQFLAEDDSILIQIRDQDWVLHTGPEQDTIRLLNAIEEKIPDVLPHLVMQTRQVTEWIPQ